MQHKRELALGANLNQLGEDAVVPVLVEVMAALADWHRKEAARQDQVHPNGVQSQSPKIELTSPLGCDLHKQLAAPVGQGPFLATESFFEAVAPCRGIGTDPVLPSISPEFIAN
ncbi:hypothetical protein EV13_2993 [Prochlorococcus sp. MIT 0702]|nr:hypothetical protein EV12_2939 [Prochlorococcus sp. MIT 0701]KGG26211.1 hypothetical protein EV13_2993 [Prochlorococcus sp. MIT 0702]KGG33034.1 hypothetical protein EV14_1875 [Prochlorococcus sp. MIT 0703]